MVSHWFGLIGELLNLIGAVVMGLDVFWRHKNHIYEAGLRALRVSDDPNDRKKTAFDEDDPFNPDSVANQMHRREIRTAYCGAAFLFLGFLCLSIHHVLEMGEQKKDNLTRNNEAFTGIRESRKVVPSVFQTSFQGLRTIHQRGVQYGDYSQSTSDDHSADGNQDRSQVSGHDPSGDPKALWTS